MANINLKYLVRKYLETLCSRAAEMSRNVASYIQTTVQERCYWILQTKKKNKQLLSRIHGATNRVLRHFGNDISAYKYCMLLFHFDRGNVGKTLLGVTIPYHGNP